MSFGVLLAILKTTTSDLDDAENSSSYYFVVGYLLDGKYCRKY